MMETLNQENESPKVDEDTSQLSPGAVLRNSREGQGLSIDDVSGRIKFAPRQIVALEADDFASLPEGAFLRGFVRSYARALQLDEHTLLTMLPSTAPIFEAQADQEAVDVPLPREQDERKAAWLRNAAIVVAALLILLAGWGYWKGEGKEPLPEVSSALPAASAPVADEAVTASAVPDLAPVTAVSQVAPVVAQVPQPPVAVAPVPASSVGAGSEAPLRLIFVESSWAEVRDRHGAMLMSQRNPAGSEQSFSGAAPFYVAIARVSAVKLYFKGKQVDLTSNASNGSVRMKLE